MWMSGSTVQIFSMMTTGMLVKSSIQGALNVNKGPFSHQHPCSVVHWAENRTVFNPLASGTPSSLDPETPNEEDAFIQQKLVYIACQLALLALAFYKVNSMGLLPNHSSDWLAFLPVKVVRSSHLRENARTDFGTFSRWKCQAYQSGSHTQYTSHILLSVSHRNCHCTISTFPRQRPILLTSYNHVDR